MGIKGLIPFVRRKDPTAFVPLTTWGMIASIVKSKTVAVDIPIFVHKMMHVLETDDWYVLQNEVMRMIDLLRRFEAKPIFVFDTFTPNKLKVHEHSRRRETRAAIESELHRIRVARTFSTVAHSSLIEDAEPAVDLAHREHVLAGRLLRPTRDHFVKLQGLFDSLGLPHEVADHEAEGHCAMLTQTGRADVVLTDDTDALIFGATRVIFNFFRANLLLKESSELLPEEAPKYITSPRLLKALKFKDKHQLILFAIWAGCDFTEKIPKVGPVTAYKYASENNDKFPASPLKEQCEEAYNLFNSTWNSSAPALDDDADDVPKPIVREKSTAPLSDFASFLDSL
jgi:5'-3' exonuclease